MPDRPTWTEIYSGIAARREMSMPPVPPLNVPRVRNPVCPEHCSGRHEIEGELMCPKHKVPVYSVVAHEWEHQDGHYFYALAPRNGAPEWRGELAPTCLDCGTRLVRV